MLEETDDTAEIDKTSLGSAVTDVTVNPVDCVLDGTTGAANGIETDVDALDSVATEGASTARSYSRRYWEPGS